MNETKEVYFYQYCPSCEYWNKKEDETPCDECLNVDYRIDSHKPLKYKEKS